MRGVRLRGPRVPLPVRRCWKRRRAVQETGNAVHETCASTPAPGARRAGDGRWSPASGSRGTGDGRWSPAPGSRGTGDGCLGHALQKTGGPSADADSRPGNRDRHPGNRTRRPVAGPSDRRCGPNDRRPGRAGEPPDRRAGDPTGRPDPRLPPPCPSSSYLLPNPRCRARTHVARRGADPWTRPTLPASTASAVGRNSGGRHPEIGGATPPRSRPPQNVAHGPRHGLCLLPRP